MSLETKDIFFMYIFGVNLLLLAIAYKNYRKPELRHMILTVILIVAISSNLLVTSQSIAGNLLPILKNPSWSYDDKMRYQWGDYYDYMVWVRKITPQDSVIVIPPQAEPFLMVGNIYLDSYFLYPRRLVSGTKIGAPEGIKFSHMLIVGEWPFQRPPGKIAFMKTGYGLIRVE